MSGYRGLSKLRKTFKRMEPEVQKLITKELEWAGKEVKKDAIGLALLKRIRDSGDMIEAIDDRMGRDKSSVVVGPGAGQVVWQKRPFDNTSIMAAKMSIRQKHEKWQFFKGYWAEFGTKGPVPQKPRSFMNDAWDANEDKIRARMTQAVNRALEISSRG